MRWSASKRHETHTLARYLAIPLELLENGGDFRKNAVNSCYYHPK